MSKTKSIADVINPDRYGKLLQVAEKARKRKRNKLSPKPIGHHLAVNLYDNEQTLIDTLFIDNATICKSYTAIHIDKTCVEMLPFEIESLDIDINTVTVWYKNGLSIELIRIS